MREIVMVRECVRERERESERERERERDRERVCRAYRCLGDIVLVWADVAV